MKVTRIACSQNLNPGKYRVLDEQARRLGQVRTEVWDRYGSVAGVGLRDRTIRDQWLAEGRRFPVLANPWKETLRDAKADITANLEAAKVDVRRAIRRRTSDPDERKRLYTELKANRFTTDPYLRRQMRRHWKRGHNHTHNQIVVRSDDYSTFHLGGRTWIAVPGLVKGQRIAIPLDTKAAPTGTLRLILRDGRVEVHYQIEAPTGRPCGTRVIGVDKGYTEALVDSDGAHHGTGLGAFLTEESDAQKVKGQRRNKLRAIAGNTGSERKRQNILQNNLGPQKANRRQRKTRAKLRDITFKAAHAVIDKASVVVAEDLTRHIQGKQGKPLGKNVNRRLASWTKGAIAEALENASQRRGSTLEIVNAAYTSQVDSRNGCLSGQRQGDRFLTEDGEVLQADENAARNVLARYYDSEIGRWMTPQQVKSILQERTQRHRLRLSNPDSSCSPAQALSTESE